MFIQHYSTRMTPYSYLISITVYSVVQIKDPSTLISITVYSVVQIKDPGTLISITVYVMQIKDPGIGLSFLVPVSEVVNVFSLLSVCFITS